MICIDLTEEEQQVLSDVLEGYLADVHDEIMHTDRREWREILKSRKHVITVVLERLRQGKESPQVA